MQSKNDMMPPTFGGNTGGLVSGATSVQATEGGLNPPSFSQGLPYRYLRALMKRIEKRHGLTPERWKNLQLGTKIMLMEEAEENFKEDMIKIYGSWEKYRLHTLKRRGFDSDYDYRNWLIIERNGYESHNEYRIELVQRKGFETIQEYRNAMGQYKPKTKRGIKKFYKQQYESKINKLPEGKVIRIRRKSQKITECPHCGNINGYRKGKVRTCQNCRKQYRTV